MKADDLVAIILAVTMLVTVIGSVALMLLGH